ncbi:MAG: hypothetical protein Q4D76_08665 [Oscillospiraceae bacterium]|nr:hypothetical protein [Oscillospiraceae bacterium]
MVNIINDFSFKFNSSVKLNFDGEDLTSDSGGLLIEEFMHVTGIKFAMLLGFILIPHFKL